MHHGRYVLGFTSWACWMTCPGTIGQGLWGHRCGQDGGCSLAGYSEKALGNRKLMCNLLAKWKLTKQRPYKVQAWIKMVVRSFLWDTKWSDRFYSHSACPLAYPELLKHGVMCFECLSPGAFCMKLWLCVCVQVAAEWNLTQLCEALTRYRERKSFLREALLCLYKQFNDTDIGCRPDVLKVQSDISVQHECDLCAATLLVWSDRVCFHQIFFSE